ncbi:MAG: 5-formyltetrahydrofolate cyclo-ligase [Clostridia bacterium]|nr:5-formyltetrahydrofolate cyclo-ligase [Clostridia bacterium]
MTNEEKSPLRVKFKELRAKLKSPDKDKAILRNFLMSPFFERTSFFVYHSIDSEADTLKIIKMLLDAGKEVLLPRIHKGKMLAVPYSGDTELVFGIPQPKSGLDCPAEVILTPLLAFDKDGFRLGYGGGYYDKYFAEHKGLRVGLAYGGQAVDSLPRDKFDLPLHAVVTEAGVRYFT